MASYLATFSVIEMRRQLIKQSLIAAFLDICTRTIRYIQPFCKLEVAIPFTVFSVSDALGYFVPLVAEVTFMLFTRYIGSLGVYRQLRQNGLRFEKFPFSSL